MPSNDSSGPAGWGPQSGGGLKFLAWRVHTKPVVGGALFRILQGLIGLGDLLEFGLGA